MIPLMFNFHPTLGNETAKSFLEKLRSWHDFNNTHLDSWGAWDLKIGSGGSFLPASSYTGAVTGTVLAQPQGQFAMVVPASK